MLQKEFTEQETVNILLENCREEGADLSQYATFLFGVIRRMYSRGLGFVAWQGSPYFARFAGRGTQDLYPFQPAPVAPVPASPPIMNPVNLPSRPGPQPIMAGHPFPAESAPMPTVRTLPPMVVPPPVPPAAPASMPPTPPPEAPAYPEMPSRF